MPLPKLSHPTFETCIPSTGAKVKFRPFVVREHKILMKAVEFEDPVNLVESFKAVISDCTFNKIDIGALPIFDVDWLYLKIKAASTGSINPVNFKCANVVSVTKDDGTVQQEECGHVVTVNIDTEAATIHVPQDSKVVFLTPTIAVTMKWPSFDDQYQFKSIRGAADVSEDLVLSSIESVSDPERTYSVGIDFTREELSEFINDLPDACMNKIHDFIQSTPDIEMTLNIRCPKCGNAAEINMVGLEDFLE